MANPYRLTAQQLQQVEGKYGENLSTEQVKLWVAKEFFGLAKPEITAEIWNHLRSAIRSRNPHDERSSDELKKRIEGLKRAKFHEVRRAARRSASHALEALEIIFEALPLLVAREAPSDLKDLKLIPSREIKRLLESLTIAARGYGEFLDISNFDTKNIKLEEIQATKAIARTLNLKIEGNQTDDETDSTGPGDAEDCEQNQEKSDRTLKALHRITGTGDGTS